MVRFRTRFGRFLYAAGEDGGGGGGPKKSYLAESAKAAYNTAQAIINKTGTVYKGYNQPLPSVISQNMDGKQKPRQVTYIGNGGTKKTGTTEAKVTPGTTPDWYAAQGKLYQQMYDDQVKANNAALEAARQRAQETTDAQIAALGQQYAGTNRQLYRDYMNSRRLLPQQLAAQGYSGGLSESSMLRLNNSYEEGLNENERARLAQETSYQQALAQQLYEAQARTTEANQQAQQNLYSRKAALQEAVWQDQQQRAATMAASGDFSEYARMGYSKSEIDYLKRMWAKMNPGI